MDAAARQEKEAQREAATFLVDLLRRHERVTKQQVVLPPGVQQWVSDATSLDVWCRPAVQPRSEFSVDDCPVRSPHGGHGSPSSEDTGNRRVQTRENRQQARDIQFEVEDNANSVFLVPHRQEGSSQTRRRKYLVTLQQGTLVSDRSVQLIHVGTQPDNVYGKTRRTIMARANEGLTTIVVARGKKGLEMASMTAFIQSWRLSRSSTESVDLTPAALIGGRIAMAVFTPQGSGRVGVAVSAHQIRNDHQRSRSPLGSTTASPARKEPSPMVVLSPSEDCEGNTEEFQENVDDGMDFPLHETPPSTPPRPQWVENYMRQLEEEIEAGPELFSDDKLFSSTRDDGEDEGPSGSLDDVPVEGGESGESSGSTMAQEEIQVDSQEVTEEISSPVRSPQEGSSHGTGGKEKTLPASSFYSPNAGSSRKEPLKRLRPCTRGNVSSNPEEARKVQDRYCEAIHSSLVLGKGGTRAQRETGQALIEEERLKYHQLEDLWKQFKEHEEAIASALSPVQALSVD